MRKKFTEICLEGRWFTPTKILHLTLHSLELKHILPYGATIWPALIFKPIRNGTGLSLLVVARKRISYAKQHNRTKVELLQLLTSPFGYVAPRIPLERWMREIAPGFHERHFPPATMMAL